MFQKKKIAGSKTQNRHSKRTKNTFYPQIYVVFMLQLRIMKRIY